MLKVGQVDGSNVRAMTARTKAKLDETLELLVTRIAPTFGDETELRFLLYRALRWTADDVLGQAVDDGYVSEQDGCR